MNMSITLLLYFDSLVPRPRPAFRRLQYGKKVGEPGFPVAATERGRKVIVRAGTTFEVGDHDFTKFSIVPSVALIVDIPNDIHESWYRVQVMVGFKDAAFEASSPIRHATELSHVLSRNDELRKPVLFV